MVCYCAGYTHEKHDRRLEDNVQRSDANKLLEKHIAIEASMVSLADRVHHLEQQFLCKGTIVTLADTRDRLDVVEDRPLESEKAMHDVGRAFGTFEEKFKKDSELLNTSEQTSHGWRKL